jgi:hypothetical protein
LDVSVPGATGAAVAAVPPTKKVAESSAVQVRAAAAFVAVLVFRNERRLVVNRCN